MTIGKKRSGKYHVYVYDPAQKRKVYVGARESLADARDLEAETKLAYRRHRPASTLNTYAQHWLEHHHGPGTRRPAALTRTHNEGYLRVIAKQFGDRRVNDIGRQEALIFARENPNAGRVASALFNDAIDDEVAERNPFANRRGKEPRGRRDITPLREDEIAALGRHAVDVWGAYGHVVRGWIVFAAWTGARPGEYFALDWRDLDLANGVATVRRVKGDRETQDIVVPGVAVDAVRDMGTLRRGLVFTSPRGKPFRKGLWNYYWNPVQDRFLGGLDRDRWGELVGGRPEGRRDLDLYELRHFCGSLMADRGASELDISRQLGNSPEVCRETYVHSHVDRALERNRGVLDGPAPVRLATHPLPGERASG